MTIEDPQSLPAEILDLPVQINVRITVRLRAKLDEYIRYMDRPETERPSQTHDWPNTMQGVVQEALTEYLARHTLKEKAGPAKTAPRTTKKGTRKSSSTSKSKSTKEE